MIRRLPTYFVVPAMLTVAYLLVLLHSIMISGLTGGWKSHVAFFNENDIIGVKLSDANRSRQLFMGFQKERALQSNGQDAPHYPLQISLLESPSHRQTDYNLNLLGTNFLVKLFLYRQPPGGEVRMLTNRNERIRHLTYIYKRCGKDEIVLLDGGESASLNSNEVTPNRRFGIVIQLMEK